MLTVEEFEDFAMHTVAHCRDQVFTEGDRSLAQRITVSEAAAVLRRERQTVYNLVCEGYLKRDNARSSRLAEFTLAELTRCAMLVNIIATPRVHLEAERGPYRSRKEYRLHQAQRKDTAC